MACFKDRVVAIEKADGGSESSSARKVDIAYLKKEVASLWSTNLSTFWDRLEDPPKVYMTTVLNNMINVDALGEGSEETKVANTLEID